jgi:DNA-binding PadR family transcriptional regulator
MHDCGCNYLQACLLLLIAERPDHGYDLATRLSNSGLEMVDTPSTYRALRSLERDRMVASQWTPSAGGPARRVYRLTAAGETALLAFGDELRRDRVRMARYLRRLEATLADRQPAVETAAPGRRAGVARSDR